MKSDRNSLLSPALRVQARALALIASAVVCAAGTPSAPALATTTTTMTLNSAGGPVTTVDAHSVITLTASVTSGAAKVTTGQVKFCDAAAVYCEDSHLLGTSQLTSAGTATWKFVPGLGSHSYKAIFAGTTSNAGSTSGSSALTVTGMLPAKATLSSTGSAGSYTLTSTMTALGPKPPSGTVYFLNQSDSLNEVGKGFLKPGTPELSWARSAFKGKGEPTGMVTGDFNGDGFQDIAFTVLGSTALSVDLGNGAGRFSLAAATTLPGSHFRSMVTADFNNDGIPDLALTNVQGENVTIMLGNGDGTFTEAAASIATGVGPNLLVVGDFNGDGNADLAMSYVEHARYSSNLTIYVGSGDGSFTLDGPATESAFVFGGIPQKFVTGDFNSDGRTDLVVLTTESGLDTLIATAEGPFTVNYMNAPNAAAALTVGDFNGDGRPDLAVLQAQYSPFQPVFNAIRVFLGSPDGILTGEGETYAAFGFYPKAQTISAGDFNGDGIEDLALGYSGVDDPTIVLLNSGKGTFTAAPTSAPPSPKDQLLPIIRAMADFDGDGVPDMATAGYQYSSGKYGYAALLTHVTQRATATSSGTAPAASGSNVVVAKFEGDGTFLPARSNAIELTGQTGIGPVATLSTTLLQFSGTSVSTKSNAQTLTLTNTGTAPLTLGGIGFAAGFPPFATANDCPASLAVAAACKIRVRFVPLSPGMKQAQLLVKDNAPNSPQVIALTGSAVGGPKLTLSTTQLAFYDQPLGTSSPSKSVTVSNTGTETLHFKSITLFLPTGIHYFTARNTCGATLTPGGTCTLTAHFNALDRGSTEATVIFSDDAQDSPQYLGLEGTTPPL